MMGTVGTQPVRGEIPAFVGDRVVAAAAVAVNVGDSAAAEIGRNGIELKRAPKKSLNNAAGDVASTHTMIAAASHAKGTLSPPMTSVAKPAHQQSPIARGTRMELAGELASARVAQVVAEAATRKEKAISKRKMTELESMIEATQREHERQRGTVESRLEMLQMALDQDEEENGKHVSAASPFLPLSPSNWKRVGCTQTWFPTQGSMPARTSDQVVGIIFSPLTRLFLCGVFALCAKT